MNLPPQPSSPPASIVIVTRNRKAELARALESCRGQTYRPLEVFVCDDASTDGTESVVREQFPEVRYYREPTWQGAVLRNQGVESAGGKYVFFIDDDACFTDPDTIARTIDRFEADPRIGLVAMPFVEPRNPRLKPPAVTLQPGQSLRGFIGCACAVRRDAFLKIGGYRKFLGWGLEENDLSIRLLDAGYEIVYGDTPPVVHRPSPRRSQYVQEVYPTRNQLLFDWLNLTPKYLLLTVPYHTWMLLKHDLRPHNFPLRVWGVLCGYWSMVRYFTRRKAVSAQTCRRYFALPQHCGGALVE